MFNITIIGACNAGCAHAFKLSEKGHRVNLVKTSYSMHNENLEKIKTNNGIWAIDHTNEDLKSFQKLNMITRDIEDGLKNADIVLVMTQSLQHDNIEKRISPYIGISVKMLLVIPGNLGSVIFSNKLNTKNIIIGEGESTPYDARIIEPGVVNILFRNIRNSLGFLPSSKNEVGLVLAKKLLDTYYSTRSNVIESALHNPNIIVHTIGVIMSANRIEYTNGEYWMYREAFTESIWNLIKALDEEKNKVISAFSGVSSSYVDECKFRNEEDLSKDSMDVFKSYANDGGPKGPSTIYSRYLFEDVPNGLCLLSSLGEKAGIKTPVCDSLINIASNLVQTDFLKIGRTVNKFGWKDKSKNEIVRIINGKTI